MNRCRVLASVLACSLADDVVADAIKNADPANWEIEPDSVADQRNFPDYGFPDVDFGGGD